MTSQQSKQRGIRRRVAALAVTALGLAWSIPAAEAAKPITSLTWSPAELTFNAVGIGGLERQNLTLTNTGTKTVRRPDVSVIGTDYFITFDSCATAVLRAGDACIVTITFAPLSGGSSIGAVSTIASKTNYSVNLSGNATAGDPLTSAAASQSQGCAITATGALQCWGDNAYGQVGDGSTVARRVPIGVRGLSTGVAAVTVGAHHACALTTAGGVKCWGRNDAAQLGTVGAANSSTPVDVPGLASGVTSIAAGISHTCAVMATGTVMCWGSNAMGQLGVGAPSLYSAPVPVLDITAGASAIAAVMTLTCAIVNGDTRCWGSSSAPAGDAKS